MSTIKKIGCVPVCICFLFYSCRPLHVFESVDINITPVDSTFPTTGSDMYRNDVPLRAVREVLTRFGDAKDVTWKKTGQRGWLATFTIGPVETRMEFNKNGTWSQIWSRYMEPPRDVAATINNNFGGYHIDNVWGLIFPSDSYNMVLSAIITKGNNCKILNFYKGRMTIFSDFENANALADQDTASVHGQTAAQR